MEYSLALTFGSRMPEERRLMDRDLSTLEQTVLGMVWLRGPCTTYSVMKELSDSISDYHQSRAGAVYSVAARLRGKGLITAEGHLVEVTPEGLAELQAWLRPPIRPGDLGHSADLVRLRFFFLGALEPAERLAFVDHCREGLTQHLQACRDLLAENEAIGDYFGVLATASGVLETEARIAWLGLVRELVEHPLPEGWAAEVSRRLSARDGG